MRLAGFDSRDAILLFNILKMNIRDRYLDSTLGLVWAVLNPLLTLVMYTFIFGFVFKAKLPGAETTFAYAIWLIAGLVPYMAVSEAMAATCASVVAGAGMVKNVVFKSEVLPYAAALTAILPFSAGMCFVFIMLVIDGNYPTWHALLVIPLIIIQFVFLGGLGLFLAATTVFIRDIQQAIATVIMLFMFFTPIFYTREMMPRIIDKITFFNPLYHMTQPYRDVMLYHRIPDLAGIAYVAGLAVILNFLGLLYFRRLKGFFEMKL